MWSCSVVLVPGILGYIRDSTISLWGGSHMGLVIVCTVTVPVNVCEIYIRSALLVQLLR